MAEQEKAVGRPGPRLENHEILVRPLITEKGVDRSTKLNQYAFEVCPLATKSDVRRAVEELFNVKVERVCTQNRRGKERRHRFRMGKTKDWKKAIVTLDKKDKIDFF